MAHAKTELRYECRNHAISKRFLDDKFSSNMIMAIGTPLKGNDNYPTEPECCRSRCGLGSRRVRIVHRSDAPLRLWTSHKRPQQCLARFSHDDGYDGRLLQAAGCISANVHKDSQHTIQLGMTSVPDGESSTTARKLRDLRQRSCRKTSIASCPAWSLPALPGPSPRKSVANRNAQHASDEQYPTSAVDTLKC